MNKEGVAAAFDLLMEAIEKAHQEITEQITEASQNKDYEKVQTLVENGKSLYAFRSRVVNLRKEWQAGIDKTWPRKTKRTGKSSIAPATKLRVSFPNGTTIQERHAADTFAQTIRTLGIDKVRNLELSQSRRIPLVNPTARDKKYGQRQVDGWYVETHSSTEDKKKTLDQIAKALGVPMTVEII